VRRGNNPTLIEGWRSDSGMVTGRHGTGSGSFSSNWANMASGVPTDWHVATSWHVQAEAFLEQLEGGLGRRCAFARRNLTQLRRAALLLRRLELPVVRNRRILPERSGRLGNGLVHWAK
jgi:hypothetical protein